LSPKDEQCFGFDPYKPGSSSHPQNRKFKFDICIQLYCFCLILLCIFRFWYHSPTRFQKWPMLSIFHGQWFQCYPGLHKTISCNWTRYENLFNWVCRIFLIVIIRSRFNQCLWRRIQKYLGSFLATLLTQMHRHNNIWNFLLVFLQCMMCCVLKVASLFVVISKYNIICIILCFVFNIIRSSASRIICLFMLHPCSIWLCLYTSHLCHV